MSKLNVKVLPHSVEVEQMLLACILIDELVYDGISDMITPDSFYRKEHELIFTHIKKLKHARKNIDAVTVAVSLGQEEHLEYVGGHEYLNSLVESVTYTNNARSYAEQVHELYIKREVIKSCNNLVEQCYNDAESTTALISTHINALTAQQHVSSPIYYASDIIEIIKDNRQIEYVKTNDIKLDISLSGGFGKGELVIIAGKSSMGKTSIALYIFANVLKHANAIFFSLEMSVKEMTNRLRNYYCQTAEKELTNQQLDNLIEQIIGNKSIAIVDNALVTVNTLRRYILNYKIKFDTLDLIVIDYLQLMQRLPKQSEYESLSTITRELKLLAQEMKITIVCLSQLNRSGADRKDKHPILSDLRGSGSIEQDADIVMFTHREEYYCKEKGQEISQNIANKMELIIAKFRRFNPSKIVYNCNLSTNTFNCCTTAERMNYENELCEKTVSYITSNKGFK